MRIKLFAVSGLILLSPLYAALADSISSIDQLVVFGDSLSDNGNATIASHGVYPGPNYAPGRYTDGANTTPATTGPFGLWEEQFAADTHLPDPQPFLAGTGGNNYAFAGADTGSVSPFDVQNQVKTFVGTHPTGAPSAALYTIWAGANDIVAGDNPVTAADNLYTSILALSSDGAKYFLWLNLPPLGDTPKGRNSGFGTLLNNETNAFNAEWAVDIGKLQSKGVMVVGVNVDLLFNQIAADPSAYGFTDITDPAQGKVGADPNQYLFWDDFHPTTAGDALVADLALHDFVATPEPASFGLLAVCGILFAGFRMRLKLKAEDRA
ncbi:MAG: SGNH/GDSL hydrolase family protein [Bryobacteraceae bacterium]